jgi:hypothetical protein
MTEAELRALGFTQTGGILHAPADAAVTLTPSGDDFFELRIRLSRLSGISVVVSKIAIKKDPRQ